MTVGSTSRSHRQVAGDPLTEKESENSTRPFSKRIGDFVRNFFSSYQTSSHRYRPNYPSSNPSLESRYIGNLQHGTWNNMGYRRLDNNEFNRQKT